MHSQSERQVHGDTIAAISTPPGTGAIGVIRLSGPQSFSIASNLAGDLPPPRQAGLRRLRDEAGAVIDEAVVIAFPGPNSFTGEDVVELQGHGGPAVLEMILERVIELGGRHARPGEFSERAFLNGRIDLAQAEAIADLIAASSRTAARCALRSLQGEFSKKIQILVDDLMRLRVRVEADLDFSDEDIDPKADQLIASRLEALRSNLEELLNQARQGVRLGRGFVVVLSGPPNVGKSSLLNRLADRDVAIVTPIPGTTRDLLRAHIEFEGVSVEVVDTAGLRETSDPIEQEGVRRAYEALAQADLILHLFDDCHPELSSASESLGASDVPVLKIYNKIDLSKGEAGRRREDAYGVSALEGTGMQALRTGLMETLGLSETGENAFIARARHVAALKSCLNSLCHAQEAHAEGFGAELLAEELRAAQNSLGEITGQVSNEDLLGAIFSTFCIGK